MDTDKQEFLKNYITLSPTEKMLFKIIAEDCSSNIELVAVTGSSISTIKTHIRHIFNKMLYDTREEIVRDYWKYKCYGM